MATIMYCSRTGNVQAFVNKVKALRPDWSFYEIHDSSVSDILSDINHIAMPFHIITYTTGFGDVPNEMNQFIAGVGIDLINTVAASGNRNWGRNFGVAADKISMLQTQRPPSPSFKFELQGTSNDVQKYIEMVEDNINVKKLHIYP